MRSNYEKTLDQQLIYKKSVSPNDSVAHTVPDDDGSDNEFRSSNGGGAGSLYGRRSNLKKTVRFQVYNATNLNSIQEMRKKKL